MSPEEHSLFTVEMGTRSGMPAERAAAREAYRGEGGWHVPTQTSSILEGSKPVLASVAWYALQQVASQVVGLNPSP